MFFFLTFDHSIQIFVDHSLFYVLQERNILSPIDDLSCYGYIYLMHEKSQAIDIFEMFITEVERQLDKKIKIVRSDRGGEYYGRYDESG